MVRFSKQFAAASLKDTVKILLASSGDVTQRNGYSRGPCRPRAQWNTVLDLRSLHGIVKRTRFRLVIRLRLTSTPTLLFPITIHLPENEGDQMDEGLSSSSKMSLYLRITL